MTVMWLEIPAAPIDATFPGAAPDHRYTPTKPPCTLGGLEEIALRLAAMQRTARPAVGRVRIVIFAGDHGVAEEVSALPQAVMAETVRNLAREIGASLEVINLGTAANLEPLAQVIDKRLGPGTANFVQGPAMTEKQFWDAFHTGRHAVERAALAGTQLFIGGGTGIGSTTAAAAVACALLSARPALLAGPGADLDHTEAVVLERALALHRDHLGDPVETLRRLGGFELAALTGAFISCAHIGLPAVVDSFVTGVAALAAARLCAGASEWFLLAHAPAEPGHACVLQALQARSLPDLGLHLGKGSGATAAVSLLRFACALHDGIVTCAEAEAAERHWVVPMPGCTGGVHVGTAERAVQVAVESPAGGRPEAKACPVGMRCPSL